MKKKNYENKLTLVGLEPTIYPTEGECGDHYTIKSFNKFEAKAYNKLKVLYNFI